MLLITVEHLCELLAEHFLLDESASSVHSRRNVCKSTIGTVQDGRAPFIEVEPFNNNSTWHGQIYLTLLLIHISRNH